MNVIPRLLLIVLITACGIAHAETQFTYQGRLGNAGQPADGLHDFQFRLFDDEIAGGQVGVDQSLSSVDVDAGIFTVQLDFGDGPFNAAPRWLEIAVRETGAGAYTTLTPRQRIGAAPFAIETLFVAPGAVDNIALQDNAVTTQKIADGNIFHDDLANFAVGTAKLSNQAVTRLKIADNAIGTSQIEDDVVTSADIRDGTITPEDIDGGLYARKTQVLYYTSQAAVSAGKVVATVSCADNNDIPVIAVCNPLLTLSALRLVSERISDFGSDAGPATLQCRMVNDNPSVPEAFEATIGCVAVP
ncbi:MAG: hypothetical protein R3F12_00200 [Lysobacteraceae bacterium]|nr:hypothetical protein [Xanthomonadaceae bacterium]HRY01069.1 hypothetical protein [Xanthomonadaceae bacterium]